MSEVEEYPELFLRLTNTQDTSWTLEGTEKDRNPARLSAPGLYRIPSVSKYKVPNENGKGFRFQKIRYIAACDSIDPEFQDKNKYVPNVEADNIWFENGILRVRREGSTIGLYDYLMKYEGNANNPDRPDEAGVDFEVIIESVIAANNNLAYDVKSDAFALLREIRTREGDEFVYDEAKLQLMAVLFNLTHLETPEEQFNELYYLADTRPELLVNSFANSKKALFANIKQAEDMGVLAFESDRAYFPDTKVTVLTYKGKVAKNSQAAKLADFFLTAEGKPFYEQLKNMVSSAGTQSLARMD